MIDLGKLFGGDISGAFGGAGSGDLLNLGGAAAGLFGGFTAAGGAEDAGRAQSKAFLENAQVQGQNASTARFTVARNQQYANYLTSRLKGQQEADFGAANVGPVGSPADVMADTEAAARFEAFNRFYAGEQEAKQAGTQAEYDVEAAQAARKAARTNSTSAILGGIGTAVQFLPKIFALAGPAAAVA